MVIDRCAGATRSDGRCCLTRWINYARVNIWKSECLFSGESGMDWRPVTVSNLWNWMYMKTEAEPVDLTPLSSEANAHRSCWNLTPDRRPSLRPLLAKVPPTVPDLPPSWALCCGPVCTPVQTPMRCLVYVRETSGPDEASSCISHGS